MRVQLDKDGKTKIALTVSFILLTAWLILLYWNWEGFQNLRHSDIFWELTLLGPLYFIILGGQVMTIMGCIWYELENKWLHVVLISFFALTLLCTPYLISGLALFPDTITVASDVNNLPSILSNGGTSYSDTYPMSYFLFYNIKQISNIDLLAFARLVFSPLVIISFSVLWYLFIKKVLNAQIALLSTTFAMPFFLIEVSITPNSVGMILVLTSLLLIMTNSTEGTILMLIVALVLVLTHPFNIALLLVFLISIILANIYSKYSGGEFRLGNIASLAILPVAGLIWLGWNFINPKGSQMLGTIIATFNGKSHYFQQFQQYAAGSGNLTAYPWIQNLTQDGFMIIGLLGAMIFIYGLIHRLRHRKFDEGIDHGIAKQFDYDKILFLTASILFLALSFGILLLFGEGQEIVGRSLNFAMLSLSAYIAIFALSAIASLRKRDHRLSVRCFYALLIALFLIVTIIYPIRTDARDSYVSYSSSYGSGIQFSDRYFGATEQKSTVFNENAKNLAAMESLSLLKSYEKSYSSLWSSHRHSCLYNNGYYTIFI